LEIRDAIIIGGGITGLAAAYYLEEEGRVNGRPLSYTLLESDHRLGGKIVTEQTGGFTIEGGPDCFISQKPWATQLCGQLGLGSELIGTNDDRRKTFVVNRGRLAPLPDGVMLIIPTRIMPFVTSTLISWPGKIRMGMDLFIPRRKNDEDESIADFVRRRLGREALDKIAEPLLSGIHVSDPERQSLLGTFPRFRNLEKQHRSLIIGMLAQKRRKTNQQHPTPSTATPGTSGTGPAPISGHPMTASGNSRVNGHNGAHSPTPPLSRPHPSSLFISLRGGLGQMVAKLGSSLGGEIVTGARVVSLERIASEGESYYGVRTADGAVYCGRTVVLATPAYVSGSLVSGLAPELSAALSAIRYVSTATVSLGYRAADVGGRLNGFGVVIPRSERRQISACTYTSTKFNHRAPVDGALVRCFVGGPGHEEMVDRSDTELLSICRQEVAALVGIAAEPVVSRIFRWYKANPQYDVGHLDRVATIRAMTGEQPGLFIGGSAFDGVGVPDCVRQGQQAAKWAAEFVARDKQLRSNDEPRTIKTHN
jgi:protoporphyrinogen/coproporphyrinogen III oxidase